MYFGLDADTGMDFDLGSGVDVDFDLEAELESYSIQSIQIYINIIQITWCKGQKQDNHT